jgi:hypothetical protein
MKTETIVNLDICLLKDILGSESLRISNENWLFEFVMKLGSAYLNCFDQFDFEDLSGSSIDSFFERAGFENIDPGIWDQLWTRMRYRIIDDVHELSLNRFTSYITRTPNLVHPFQA